MVEGNRSSHIGFLANFDENYFKLYVRDIISEFYKERDLSKKEIDQISALVTNVLQLYMSKHKEFFPLTQEDVEKIYQWLNAIDERIQSIQIQLSEIRGSSKNRKVMLALISSISASIISLILAALKIFAGG